MIWLTAIVEMVAKLPLNLQRIMPHKAVNGEELAALAEVCLKYCQLVTDVWVEQFQVLLQSDGCEATFSSFGSTWLAYIRILAVNLSISPTTSCLHDSMLGQLGSLLQLLQICPSLDAGTRTEVEGNGHWRSRLLEESWKAALKEYSDLPQQLMPLHPSLVKQSDRSSSSSNFTT